MEVTAKRASNSSIRNRQLANNPSPVIPQERAQRSGGTYEAHAWVVQVGGIPALRESAGTPVGSINEHGRP